MEKLLNIENNDALRTFSGFSTLQTIGGDLWILENDVLTSIPSFNALTRVDSTILVADNPLLPTVSGFGALQTIGGYLSIRNSAKLTSIPSFNALTRVDSSIVVRENPLLPTVSGFGQLATIGRNLRIQNNDALTIVSGFGALASVGRGFLVFDNAALATLSGFGALATITRDLIVRDNAKLSSCCGLLRIADDTVVPGGSFTLTNNVSGCNSVDEIPINCDVTTRMLIGSPAILNVTADAGRTAFNVTTNVTWEITKRATDDWITAITPPSGSDNQQITIEYKENTAITTRDAIFTLEATGGGTETLTITLTQDAAARELSADKTRITVTADAGSATFNVTANVPWEITKRDTDDWVTAITPPSGSDDQQITIVYTENTAITTRDATLTLSATDGSETTDITITQEGVPVVGLPTLAQHLRFYPNPASHTLYIEGITQETSLIIRTFSGKTLLRATLHQNQAIDLASLPQGVYLLTLQSGQENAQEQFTRRLVIGL